MLKKIKKILCILGMVIAVATVSVFTWWWFLDGGEGYYRYTFHKNHEPFTFRDTTNTDPIYSDEKFYKTLQNQLHLDDSTMQTICDNSYVIPGLKATRTITDNSAHTMDICTSMTPQGITFANDYVLISAYCCTKQHNSVIYVLDKDTHDFLKEIVLPDKSHVGSIAFDNIHNNVWVCCYNDSSKTAFVCAFSLEEMEKYQFDISFSPIRYSLQYPIDTQKRTSFMNYYDNALYVGYFETNIKAESTVQEFELNDDGGLKTTPNLMNEIYEDEPDEYALPSSVFYISGNAQGMALNSTFVAITQSHGSDNTSRLRTFSNLKNSDGNVDARDFNFLNAIDLPVMAEDCYMDAHGNLYVCFESAAYAYRARKCDHVDRIVYLPAKVYS